MGHCQSNMDKIIVQCCSRKNGNVWCVSDLKGMQVKFVAHPEMCEKSGSIFLYKPDDKLPNNSMTWRQYLVEYNNRGNNPDFILQAGDLYQPPIYHSLVSKYGWENTYILSAGWGLIRSDFYTPFYDITFSKQADLCKQRSHHDRYDDFNHLNNDKSIGVGCSIYFFGGVAYLPLLYSLTNNIHARKVVYYTAFGIQEFNGYEYIKYKTEDYRNWYYSCAQDFIGGEINR